MATKNEADIRQEDVHEEHLAEINQSAHWLYMLLVIGGGMLLMLAIMAALGPGGGGAGGG